MVLLTAAGALTPVATADASAATLPFDGHGSIGEAYVTGVPPGTRLAVLNASGAKVGSGVVDRLGSLVIRDLTPGPGYRFAQGSDSSARRTAPFSVLSTSSTPPASFYSGQQLHAGLNYVRMRDGILLAATVRLPPGKTLADGPFPTVIEYSGYNVAGPHSLIDALEGHASSSDPLLPDTSTVVGSVVAPLLGFATVSVQMRGTGCSGGAFDLFGLPSDYDGYDVVQAVGAQPWVLNHKVGMVGISYSGFSQLVVAGTDPPDLAAIAPLSPTDDLYSTGYPGGIYNDGFAASWVAERASDARPAPGGGQPWATAEIATGDKTCLANQQLHPQAQSLESLVSPNLGRTPALFTPRSPTAWARNIKVPVFLVGALQDEQVGPQWPRPHCRPARRQGRLRHHDERHPHRLARSRHDFALARVPRSLRRRPRADTVADPRRAGAHLVLGAHGRRAVGAGPRRPVHERALGRRGQGRLRRAGPTGARALRQRWWIARAGRAPTHLRGGVLVLATHAALSSATASDPPARCKRVRRRARPPRRSAPTPRSGRPTTWPPRPTPGPPSRPTTGPPCRPTNGIAFDTPAFTSATTIVGPASLNLMLRSTAPVTDLQVTVTEVRPGQTQEEYVTSGFLRSSDRALSAASTPLDPVPTYLTAQRRPLPKGSFTLVRIPIDPIAHTFRAGTRLRIVISAPGGDRPSWTFDTPATHGAVVDTVALGGLHGSSLVLNAVGGVVPSSALPACGALRGEPCRADIPLGNQG